MIGIGVCLLLEMFCKTGPRERATLEVHLLSWLLSNNQLEEVCSTITNAPFLIDCCRVTKTKNVPSVANPLALTLGTALYNQCCQRRGLPAQLGYFEILCRGSKNCWAGGLKLGYFSFVCPQQLFFLQICQFPVNSESFWASSMPKNILFINFRD